MCIVSMVYDHFQPQIPTTPWTWPPQPGRNLSPWEVPYPDPTDPEAQQREFERLTKIINDFRRAVSAAEVVDEATGQKDCLDPEKASLTKRVDELEKAIKELQSQAKSKKPKKTAKPKKNKSKRP